MSDDYKFDTLSLHAGHVPDDRYGSRAVPIHQTTSYVFKDTRHAAALYIISFSRVLPLHFLQRVKTF